jgi:hypothetical protein
MSKLLKLSSILIVISLLALSLAACRSWEGALTLVVKVDTPRDGATVTASPVTVSGRVGGIESAKATVKINDADVTVTGGKFSTSVTLTEGTNVIKVVATSDTNTQSQTVTVTYAPAK